MCFMSESAFARLPACLRGGRLYPAGRVSNVLLMLGVSGADVPLLGVAVPDHVDPLGLPQM